MIFVVRHGETVWNREGRNQGRCDSPLTLRGVRQAQAYGELLRREIPAGARVELHASPLYRAWQTAVLVQQTLGADAPPPRLSPLLMEVDCGEWQGLTPAEIEARHPGRLEEFRARLWESRAHGGESRADAHARAQRWLTEPRLDAAIVVAHGVVSRVLRGAWLELSGAEILALPPHTHGRVFRLTAGRVEELPIHEEPPPAPRP